MAAATQAKTLTTDQKALLRKQEAIIRRGQVAFLATSQAVLVIERERLFLPHRSISAYCFVVWDMSAPEVSRCRSAALVLETLEKAKFDKLPSNESQAGALAHLEEATDQITAWKTVLDRVAEDKKAKVTAALIHKVVAELFGEKEAEPQQPKPKPPVETVTTAVKDLTDMAALLDVEKLEAEEKTNLEVQVDELEKLVKFLKDSLRPTGSRKGSEG